MLEAQACEDMVCTQVKGEVILKGDDLVLYSVVI